MTAALYIHIVVLLLNPPTQSLLLLLLLRNSSWFRRRSPLVGYLLSAVDLSALSFGTSHTRRDRRDPDINDRRTISAYNPLSHAMSDLVVASLPLFHPFTPSSFLSLSLPFSISIFISHSLWNVFWEPQNRFSVFSSFVSVFQSFSLSCSLY